jgi:hypothetical protein
MKARVTKARSIEQENLSIVDELNQMYLSKTGSDESESKIATIKNSISNQVPANLKLAVSFLSGDVGRSMNNRCDTSNSPNLSPTINFTMGPQIGALGVLTGVNQLEVVKQSQLDKDSSKQAATSKYLKINRLSKSSYGDRADRYAAINQKVESNMRMLKTEDYKIFQKIRKVHNLGFVTMTLSVPAFFMTVFARGISNSVKLNMMKSSIMFMVMTGGVLGHYTWKYSKFLDHLNNKYFYAASINDLQNKELIKTNLPKNIVFESSNWDLRSKFLSPKCAETTKVMAKDYL